jgi:hypothetical protein
MTIEDSRIIARFQCLLTKSLIAKRLGQWRPESKDALYQMLSEEPEQRDLKKTPEYRNVMLRADQHAEWLAGLSRLSNPIMEVSGIFTKLKRAFRKIRLITSILEKSLLAETTIFQAISTLMTDWSRCSCESCNP